MSSLGHRLCCCSPDTLDRVREGWEGEREGGLLVELTDSACVGGEGADGVVVRIRNISLVVGLEVEIRNYPRLQHIPSVLT
jgi:hypothetical protein